MHDVRCTYCICQELEGEQSWRSTNPANIDPGWGGGEQIWGDPTIKNAACESRNKSNYNHER